MYAYANRTCVPTATPNNHGVSAAAQSFAVGSRRHVLTCRRSIHWTRSCRETYSVMPCSTCSRVFTCSTMNHMQHVTLRHLSN